LHPPVAIGKVKSRKKDKSMGQNQHRNDPNNRAESVSAALQALAQHLLKQQEQILQVWREATERDPAMSVSSHMTRAEFADHIPQLLQVYSAKLRAWPHPNTSDLVNAARASATAHGSHRWQQGYNLKDIGREWGRFNEVMVECLDSYGLAQTDVHPHTLPAARSALAQLLNEGISSSIDEFYRLQSVEAEARANDLEAALNDVQLVTRVRGEVLREVSHDLHGSLGIVQGAVFLLNNPHLSEDERTKIVQLVQRGATTLHTMLSDMLDLARLESGREHLELHVFNVAEVLQELCDTSQPLAYTKQLFLHATGPERLLVEGDSVKIRRIAQNLVLNAIKYTAQGGVTLSWSENEAERWVLHVQDSGTGLPQGAAAALTQELKEATQITRDVGAQSGPTVPLEDAPAAFSRRTPTTLVKQIAALSAVSVGHGEGVGLTIVKRLCELLNATLELDSKPGQGSLFRVVFPRRYDA
jgi:signal transduction histidine kinase